MLLVVKKASWPLVFTVGVKLQPFWIWGSKREMTAVSYDGQSSHCPWKLFHLFCSLKKNISVILLVLQAHPLNLAGGETHWAWALLPSLLRSVPFVFRCECAQKPGNVRAAARWGKDGLRCPSLATWKVVQDLGTVTSSFPFYSSCAWEGRDFQSFSSLMDFLWLPVYVPLFASYFTSYFRIQAVRSLSPPVLTGTVSFFSAGAAVLAGRTASLCCLFPREDVLKKESFKALFCPSEFFYSCSLALSTPVSFHPRVGVEDQILHYVSWFSMIIVP